MAKTGKKSLALLLAALMLLSITPLNGLGELLATKVSAAKQGDYTYEVIDSEVTILDFNSSITGDVVIPATLPLNGVDYPVTRIGNEAFAYCKFTNVTIPDSVTAIGEQAFSYCDNLVAVTVPDSVTSIGMDVFWDCEQLTTVHIGKGVTTIGAKAFSACSNLTSIEIDGDNPNNSSDENGILFDKEKTRLIQYPIGKPDTSYTVAGVTAVGDFVLVYCNSFI